VATATEASLGDFYGSVDFDFSASPFTETDECIALSDDKAPGLAQNVCYADLVGGSKTIDYSIALGPFGNDVCGGIDFDNTARFVTTDTGANGTSTATVPITGDCPGGCTLTQGYWKTHADGSKHYDEVWASVGGSSSIFLHGLTFIEVMKTPVAGNAWYQLAHQYIAALLNVNAGADGSALGSALTDAYALLSGHNPITAVAKSEKSAYTTLAGTLASFNEGTLPDGPAHCSV
jgi:hypothetical protein